MSKLEVEEKSMGCVAFYFTKPSSFIFTETTNIKL